MASAETQKLADEITERNARKQKGYTEERVGIGYRDQPTPRPFYYAAQIESLVVNEELVPASLTSAVDQHNQSAEVLASRWEKLIEGPPLDAMAITLDEAKQMGHTRRDGQIQWLRDFSVVAEVQRDLYSDAVTEWGKEIDAAESELAKARKQVESSLERAGFHKSHGGGMAPRRGVPATVAARQVNFQVARAPIVVTAEKQLKHFAVLQSESRKEATAAEQRRQDCLDELQRVISEAMN